MLIQYTENCVVVVHFYYLRAAGFSLPENCVSCFRSLAARSLKRNVLLPSSSDPPLCQSDKLRHSLCSFCQPPSLEIRWWSLYVHRLVDVEGEKLLWQGWGVKHKARGPKLTRLRFQFGPMDEFLII